MDENLAFHVLFCGTRDGKCITPVLLCVGRRVTTPSAPAPAPTARKPIAARTWWTPAKRPEKQVHV